MQRHVVYPVTALKTFGLNMCNIKMLSIREVMDILLELENEYACEYIDIRFNNKDGVLEIRPTYFPPRDEEKNIKNIIA
jgi:hypothetical protein